ncbi:MAG: FtsX-like permease family protein [Actinobacteria bacterium]|nr:FtsX-like permease family protein [Actinomycetota bacterium]
MLRVTFKNLLARKFRLVLTSLAVVLGVAFMAGTFVLTDTLGNVFDGLFSDVYRGVDVGVRGAEPFDGETAGGPGTMISREPIDASVLDDVEEIDGVRFASGFVGGDAFNPAKVSPLGKSGKVKEEIIHGQAPQLGVTWGPRRQLNHAFGGDGRPEVGRPPDGRREVALDEVTAEDAGITFDEVRRCVDDGECGGARVQISFNEFDPTIFRVVGIFQFGTTGSVGLATLAAFDTETAQTVMNREGQFDEIRIEGEEGVSQRELRSRVRDALEDAGIENVEALTGVQLADDQSDEIKQNLQFFNIFLLVFAMIALFVGAFIIYNTFSIIVAQRTHELGLLRGLGASGRQVMGSVAIEAVVVGLISSVLGLVLGVGVAIGLQEMMKAFDVRLPSGNTVILARTVIVSVIVGTLVTVVSAISPARRAAATPPVVAMQMDAAGVSSGARRYRVGAMLTGIGVIALALGLFADVESFPGGAASLVGLSCAVVFIGVAMLSPLVARPVSNLVGWLPARVRGVSGRLARENATRNPRRTATTAAALMIGIALLTLVAIIGASIRSTFKDIFANDVQSEVVLSSKNFIPWSPRAADAVREAIPGAAVTEFRFGNAQIAGETEALLGISPNLGQNLDITPRGDALTRFRQEGGFLFFEDAYAELPAAQRKAGVVTVEFAATGEQEIPIAGMFENKDAIGNELVLALPDFEANFTNQANVFAFVKLPEDTPVRQALRAANQALEPFPSVESEDQSDFIEAQQDQIGQFLNLINVLLFFAVLIAILGVANTLALSIFERTREIGLLRAVGMERKQVRRMIRYESIIISVFGSLLGIVLGLVFGRALVAALESEGITFALSISALVILIVLAIAAGWLAGWGPARRAARLDVLKAVQSQ